MQNLKTQIRTKQIQFDMKLEEAVLIGQQLQQLHDQQEALENPPPASPSPTVTRARTPTRRAFAGTRPK